VLAPPETKATGGVSALNGGWLRSNALQLIMAVFQAIIVGLGVEVRSMLKDHDRRLGVLEVSQQIDSSNWEHLNESMEETKPYNWTLENQLQHELDMKDRLNDIWREIDALKYREK